MNSTYTVTTVLSSFPFSALFTSHFHEYFLLTSSLLLIELLLRMLPLRPRQAYSMVVCTFCLATLLTTPYAHSFSNKCKVILLCTSIKVLASSNTVLHQVVSQKQLYKKRHYECLMLSVWNGNSNKWKNWKLSCIGKSAKQHQKETKMKIYWLRNLRKKKSIAVWAWPSLFEMFLSVKEIGKNDSAICRYFYKNVICICINAAVYHMCHSTKQECCSELNTLTIFDRYVNAKGLASSKY